MEHLREAWQHAIATRQASLDHHLYWRTHPSSRTFSVADATSTTFHGGLHDVGYSCFASPWHLWLYIDAMRWTGDAKTQDIIGFSGTRVGTGNDGEDLAMPDMAVVKRMRWGEFERELATTPLPPTPTFGPGWDGYSSWTTLAKTWKRWGLEIGEDPVVDKVLSAVASSKTAARPKAAAFSLATKIDGNEIMKMLDRRYMSRPDANTSTDRRKWFEEQPEFALVSLDGAMNRYRSSFGASDRIRAGAAGQGNSEDQKFGKAILAGIQQGDTYDTGYRVSHGGPPTVGQTLIFTLVSLTKSLEDARGFENSSNFAGVGNGRGSWFVFHDFPAVEYPDGREYISSGRFRVDGVRPFTPPWEGKPGSDITLAGKRTKSEVTYLGPL